MARKGDNEHDDRMMIAHSLKVYCLSASQFRFLGASGARSTMSELLRNGPSAPQ